MAWEFVSELRMLPNPECQSQPNTHLKVSTRHALSIFLPALSWSGEKVFVEGGDLEKLWAHIRQQLPPPSLFSSTFLWVGDGDDGLDGKGASPPCQLPLWAWGQLSAPWQLSASLWPPEPSGFTLSAQINLHIEWCHYFALEKLLAGIFQGPGLWFLFIHLLWLPGVNKCLGH